MTTTLPSLPENFILTAHRGARDRAPENTILAFTEAEKLGFLECELDVQVTCDNVLVVGHDRTPDRVALSGNLNTPLTECTFAQVRDLDLGLGQTVPTFNEVLDATQCLLQVEIKEPRAAQLLAQTLATRSQRDRDRCVITSFFPYALRVFKKNAAAGRGIGFLVADLSTDWRYYAEDLEVTHLFLHWPHLTREKVASYQADGYTVCASMFNDAGEFRRVLHTGVTGTSTDRPAFAQALIAEHMDR